ncbi:uncharacterized protein [Nicotiana tomentosiformis]|uniref:uncharacterized protein n=1 Tax=Nicotiana tomentosiformis TaxID=4098 RepID=UPI00388C8C9F
MASYEALYGKWCRSLVGWFEPGEARLLGTHLVHDGLEKVKLIQDRLCMSQSRRKSYADRKIRDVAYMVGEKVLLRFLPMKGVMRFGKKVKASPRYIGPFEKYFGDPSHGLDFSKVQLDGDLTYDVEPVAILNRQVLKLRSKNIASVKVQWRGQPVEEATWETERDMRSRYTHLFETLGKILDPFVDEHLYKRFRM